MANCLINTDYYGVRGVVIKKEPDKLILENPGYIRTGKEQMRKGGESDPRNKALMKMFNLINIGERAGSGVPNIFNVWEDEGWIEPVIEEKFDPDRTILTLEFKKKSGDKKATKKSDDKKATKKSDGKKVTKKTQAQYDKESNDKSSTNVSENTCEDIPDTSISDTSISDTCVADMNTSDTSTSETEILKQTYENNKEQFYISEIPDDIFEKMQGKSYKADCTLPRENLRYIHVLHVGFDNQVHEGELVVNKDIADDVLEIFKELYESGYQIEKVRLVDEYDADDEASMSDNNSSAFNFRFISHTTKISKHGMGMAVDINTLYNPYVKTVDGELSIEPANGADYVDRSKDFSHKIDHDDLCYKLFTEHGFEWGGDWTHSKDYQHFEK